MGCVLTRVPHGLSAGLACALAWPAPAVADAERGRVLLAHYQCGRCHLIPGVAGAAGTEGPNLAAFGRRSYIAGEVPNTPAALAQWIVAPAALVPTATMPALGAGPDDARAMAAYLGRLK